MTTKTQILNEKDRLNLINEYNKSNVCMTYVQWLEAELMKSRKQATDLSWDIDFREGR